MPLWFSAQLTSWSTSVLSDFAQNAVWPATLLVLAAMFHKPLSALIGRSHEVNAELGPIKVRVGSSGAAIRQAAESKTEARSKRKLSDSEIQQAAREAISEDPDLTRRLILWVDDQPRNNDLERRAFEALGIRVINVLSTNEALRALQFTPFDLIISDMGRPEGQNAGLDFVRNVRELGVSTPVVIYSSEAGVAASAGAPVAGATAHPDELYGIVLRELTHHRRRTRRLPTTL